MVTRLILLGLFVISIIILLVKFVELLYMITIILIAVLKGEIPFPNLNGNGFIIFIICLFGSLALIGSLIQK